MQLTINSEVAREYGIHSSVVLAYLQYCHDHDHDNEGRFSAPQFDLQVAFRITKSTFTRSRDALEADGFIATQRLPNVTLYTLNHDAISKITGAN